MKFEEGSIVFLCANRGVGKTTMLAYLAHGFIKQKHDVYANFEISDCWLFETEDFGKVKFPERSVILLDEAAIDFNSRNFKNFDQRITRFLKKIRKHHCMLVVASQNYNDTDKVLRDESNYLYILEKYGSFTIGKRIVNKLVLVPSQNGNQGYMGFDLYFAGLLSKGARIVCFRPLYYKYFDSWALDKGDEMPLVKALKVPKKVNQKKEISALYRYLRPHKYKATGQN